MNPESFFSPSRHANRTCIYGLFCITVWPLYTTPGEWIGQYPDRALLPAVLVPGIDWGWEDCSWPPYQLRICGGHKGDLKPLSTSWAVPLSFESGPLTPLWNPVSGTPIGIKVHAWGFHCRTRHSPNSKCGSIWAMQAGCPMKWGFSSSERLYAKDNMAWSYDTVSDSLYRDVQSSSPQPLLFNLALTTPWPTPAHSSSSPPWRSWQSG